MLFVQTIVILDTLLTKPLFADQLFHKIAAVKSGFPLLKNKQNTIYLLQFIYIL